MKTAELEKCAAVWYNRKYGYVLRKMLAWRRYQMKKVIACIAIIALLVFAADWALLGIKIFGGNYDILTEAYIGAVCFPIFFVCIAVLKLSKKCPYCGKLITFKGTYCSHCGKKL